MMHTMPSGLQVATGYMSTAEKLKVLKPIQSLMLAINIERRLRIW